MKIRAWIRRLMGKRLAAKLIATNVLLIALALTITSIMGYNDFSQSMQRNVGKYQADVVQGLTANIDVYMNELNLLSATPYQSPEIMAYLEQRREQGQTLSYEEKQRVSGFMRKTMANGRVDVAGITLYSYRGPSYRELEDSPGRFITNDDQQQAVFPGDVQSGKAYFTGPRLLRSYSGATFEVFSVTRRISSLENGEVLGYFVIDVPLASLTQRITDLSRQAGNLLWIVDQTGQDIYYSGASASARGEWDAGSYRGEGTLTIGQGADADLLTYYTSPVTDWTVIQAVPLSVLLKDTIGLKNKTIGLGLFCLGLAALVSVLISLRITRPLRLLRSSMQQVERGEFDVAIPVVSEDEVGHLSRTFNVMVSRLETLTYRLYETEIREKNAEIAALQSQINPHFLYNTLGSISLYAELQDNREVVQMTNHLSALLRYSMNGGNSEVRLQQELEHIQGYLEIQQIRFEDRLTYRLAVGPRLLDVSIVRLTLQPIVENSIIHGLEKGRGDVFIQVNGFNLGTSICIEVTDNGPGMTRKQLEQQERNMEEGIIPASPGGHGLVNVHRRLVLRYGLGYGLQLQSSAGAGMKVKVKLPSGQKDNMMPKGE
ncbi:sensor histidine kinase [Paenibacillus sp. P96]|uniref:Sensor histidine kinase n=1 Tax=Paenibacillus zeirhizosphaerae TaxID=2987519 RepID=A0ABT9FU18_9BACL|nr:sensor histidine kinase [Paenibacillus sp. P96]MDP4098206.1 sensor histidine kinase [Paenibacillus sp. P96]